MESLPNAYKNNETGIRIYRSNVRNVQFHCWGLTRRRVGPWDPFECSLELASWTLGEEEVEVTVVVNQDDEDQHRFDRFGINLGLDDSAGVRTNIYI